ncbi:MAG: helix-turn-helix transcriptional regulator [Lutibacter sp.]
MTFKERLKQLREEKELSKRELAVKLGMPPSTYNDYEAGRTQPDLPKIVKIAEFFNVNADYLLGLSESRKRIVLKREEFEHLIPPEYKEQTRDLKWVELEDFCKERDLTAENVRIIIETVLKQVK